MRKVFYIRITAMILTAWSMTAILLPNFSSDRTAYAEESKAECVMEVNTRRILYQLHGDLRLPMASTTKIATAITVLSKCNNLKEEVAIPKEAEGVEGSSVYLKAGDIYTVEDLLYGLMLRSGNDCAVALALFCSGSIGTFSTEMNKTAQKAGALHSNFKNPHGLPCEMHYTTACDLSAISCFAMQHKTFREIVSTRYYEPYFWQNKNKLLTSYNGAIGVKTGYTKEAGRCLVSAAERGGMTLVCTVLNCPNMYERSAKLLDDAFAAYRNTEILSENASFEVKAGDHTLTGFVKESYSYPLMEGEEEQLEYRTNITQTPLKSKKAGEIIGELEILLAKRLLFSTNLYKL